VPSAAFFEILAGVPFPPALCIFGEGLPSHLVGKQEAILEQLVTMVPC
jgi:hypothetical protein